MKARLKRIPISFWVSVVLIAVLVAFLTTRLEFGTMTQQVAAQTLATPGAAKVAQGLDELPKQANFEKVASTGKLDLFLDRTTGHFQVKDNRNGNVWHSYPNPANWAAETQTGVWRTHLRSPLMFRYIDLNGKLTQPKDTNFLEEQGAIKDIGLIPGGFKLTFDIPNKQITVPVEVKIEDDSVVTKIIDSGMKEGYLSLIWMRVYPFFGAEHSYGQDGYLFIPDGSGATIPFKQEHTNVNRIYQEPVFGEDLAFRTSQFGSSRKSVSMPVYGMKSENRAFLAVIEDGAEFTDVLASPSGVYSRYNWSTAQQNYRTNYRQITNEKKNRFFTTYNKNERYHGDRAVRYVLLEPQKASYVGMAERYRQYLMVKYGLKPLEAKGAKLPMTVHLVGAEREDGLIAYRYLKGTETTDAMKIVQRLYGRGVENMVINYMGWQEDGFSSFGNLDKVDSRLGGNRGMKQFISYANTLGIPVYMHAVYTRNTTGANGFSERSHGQRNLGGTVFRSTVSLGFLYDVIDRDIKFYKSLGAKGVTLSGLGRELNSDFNTNYKASREESRAQQQELFAKFKQAGLDVRGEQSNIYVAPYVSAIDNLSDDYSYDTFSNQAVPFQQIALHGLIPYTTQPSNERDEFRKQFLHDLEYGANPAYIFTYEEGGEFKFADSLHLFNPSFKDWETVALEEYQAMNAALGDVQDKFIINHRTLAPEVKETTFAGGKRIIVNYGTSTYFGGGVTVKPLDYLIVKGG